MWQIRNALWKLFCQVETMLLVANVDAVVYLGVGIIFVRDADSARRAVAALALWELRNFQCSVLMVPL